MLRKNFSDTLHPDELQLVATAYVADLGAYLFGGLPLYNFSQRSIFDRHISTVKQPTTVGERLYALRAQKGFKAERLAKQAGVDEMTIYNWESGRTQPKLLELGRVAKVLETDIENLLNKSELTWGHEIRIQRIKLGYTQKEAAKIIGVTRSTLGDWERNQYRPSERILRRLKNTAYQWRHDRDLTSMSGTSLAVHKKPRVFSI